MRRVFFSFVISFSCIYGCSTHNSRILNDSLFKETVSLKSHQAIVQEIVNIEDLWVCNDCAIVRNNRDDSIFMVYQLPDFKIRTAFGDKGRGSAEYQVPKFIKNQDTCLWVYDFGKNDVAKINIDGKKYESSPQCFPAQDRPQEIISFQNVFFVYDNFKKEFGEIVRYDSSRTVLYDFSDLKAKIKDPQGYRGFIGMNPLSGSFVYAYQYVRRFDIFDANGRIKSVNLYDNSEYPVVDNGKLDYRNSMTYYFDVITTSERIYLYYVGKSGDELSRNHKVATYIEEYDWEGNPLNKYQIDQFVKSIRFWNGKFIGIMFEAESPFVIYE